MEFSSLGPTRLPALFTGVAPFSGATTGTGGRIRDVQCTGRGAHVVAGTAGYCFGNLHVPGPISPLLPLSPSRFFAPAGPEPSYLLGQRVIVGTFSWEGGLWSSWPFASRCHVDSRPGSPTFFAEPQFSL